MHQVLQIRHGRLIRSLLCRRATLALALAVAVAVVVLCAHPVRAELLFRSNVEVTVFRAELAIEGTLLEGNTVEVNRVIMGPAVVGQKLQVERLLDLSRKLYLSEEEALSAIMRSATDKETSLPPDVTGRLVLFLKKNDRQQWETEGWGSGVRWLVEGKVYGYEQLFTTCNPYSLVPDREAKTEDELHQVIQAALAKKNKFIAARSLAEPSKRIEALAPYLQAEEKNNRYFAAAVGEIAKAGPLAGPLLRHEAQRHQEGYRRNEILKALGNCRDPEAAPYLLAMVERAAPLVKAIEPFRWETLSEAERAAALDWSIALYVLSDMADQRAIPALREAMLWGVTRHDEIFEPAVRGLGKLPSPENIPFLAQALNAIPRSRIDGAVYDCLLALKEHRYATTVPLLASKLEFPSHPVSGHDPQEYNARVAHAALVDIVGKDLGTSKEAWIQWFDAQPKQDPK